MTFLEAERAAPDAEDGMERQAKGLRLQHGLPARSPNSVWRTSPLLLLTVVLVVLVPFAVIPVVVVAVAHLVRDFIQHQANDVGA
jgi:hypothetical protein